MTNARPGEPAPDFSLLAEPGHSIGLRDLLGAPAVLVFYPNDWSPVCGDQLALYGELRDEFGRYGARLVGISVDSMWCHRAYREARRLWFPLLADFEPKGAVARAFAAYRAADGTAERALFVLRPDGVIAWRYVAPVDINPGADGILAALDDLREAA